jgi:hypothetical protein
MRLLMIAGFVLAPTFVSVAHADCPNDRDCNVHCDDEDSDAEDEAWARCVEQCLRDCLDDDPPDVPDVPPPEPAEPQSSDADAEGDCKTA